MTDRTKLTKHAGGVLRPAVPAPANDKSGRKAPPACEPGLQAIRVP
jgi:hypothetical protein